MLAERHFRRSRISGFESLQMCRGPWDVVEGAPARAQDNCQQPKGPYVRRTNKEAAEQKDTSRGQKAHGI